MSENIWVMDSELCDTCGAFLDYFGECPFCELDDEEEDFIEVDDGYDAEADMKREHEIALREGGYYLCFPEKDVKL